ncbi:MAG: IS1634 family transposase [Vulcanimicrobiaceae bacterium]
MGRAKRTSAVHVVTTTRRVDDRVYHSHLLCQSYREGGKVKKRTVGNISHLPVPIIAAVRAMLAGKELVEVDALSIERTLPHGHVEAVLAMMRRLQMAPLLDRVPSKQRDLVLAMIAQRIITPGSKLFMTRALQQSTLAEELGIGTPGPDELYDALDRLIERQDAIERRLAKRHLAHGGTALYDLSSSYLEGRCCPLAMRGYSRDERRGSLQIVYGLMCDRDGRPVAVEVFKGNTVDAQTVCNQVTKLKDRFALEQAVFVADRGMVTRANLEALGSAGIDWITALKARQVQKLAGQGALPLSLFEEQNLAEISAAEYPRERLVVCRNPLVAEERRRKREELLAATEEQLAPIAVRVAAGTLRGKAEIGSALGAVINRFKMKKHFTLEIDDERLAFTRKSEQIAAEAALDGIYILRTTLEVQACPSAEVVRSYKQFARVDRAFRTLKSVDLEIRPIHHYREHRVRAHVLLAMLAYYVEWHLREAWAELLFKDEQPPTPADPVSKAQRSEQAQRKASRQRTEDGRVVHSFKSLLDELALRARNTTRIADTEATFTQLTKPTPLQERALQLVAQLPLAS